jgi:hypothetical protein
MIASDYITLTIIDKIFTEKAETELKPLDKMIYINVLTHHFKNLEANEKNFHAFDMFPSDLQFDRFEKNYKQLQKAGLITIGNTVITFNNVWGTYLNHTVRNIVPIQDSKEAAEYKMDLMNNPSLFETLAMKHRLNNTSVMKYLELFFSEQKTIGKKYENIQDCTRHFIHWVSVNSKKINQNPSSSNSKILGI